MGVVVENIINEEIIETIFGNCRKYFSWIFIVVEWRKFQGGIFIFAINLLIKKCILKDLRRHLDLTCLDHGLNLLKISFKLNMNWTSLFYLPFVSIKKHSHDKNEFPRNNFRKQQKWHNSNKLIQNFLIST